MSCFWTALCAKVQGLSNHTPGTVIAALQSVNCYTRDVAWNNEDFSPKQLAENMEWVRAYDARAYNDGHDTSICDPFLALVAQVFRLRIFHEYTGFQNRTFAIEYRHRHAGEEDVVRFHSSTGHFA